MSKSKNRKKINSFVIHLDEPLGEGAYAKVYLSHHQDTQAQYAAKVIERSKIDADEYTSRAIKLQISIHHSLVHPNIVRIADIVQTPNNYYLFMEYCSGGSLRKLINAQPNRRISETDALHCLRCICAAFQPMFEKGIIHRLKRDLKPENVVLQGDQLKITDFGFAKALASSRQLTRTVIGTPLYMSPQMLSKKPYNSKCDVWSVGIILYEMLYGKHPWVAQSLPSLKSKIEKNKIVEFPSDVEVSELTKSLLVQCLQFEENDRLSWIELYQHQIWDSDFHRVAIDWRQGFAKAEEKLGRLKNTLPSEILVGVFLRVRAPSLNFLQFFAIMRSLMGDSLQEKEAGMMYEVFDKDSNGVIDLSEFASSLCSCPVEVLDLLGKLVGQQHYYQQLSNRKRFLELTDDEDPEVREAAFALISNMNY